MAICLFILKECKNQAALRTYLADWGNSINCTIVFSTYVSFCDELSLSESDIMFELVDKPWNEDCSIFLAHDNYTINGLASPMPLFERLCKIEELASISLQYACGVEIYMGEDTHYLPDYEKCSVPIFSIAVEIYQKYLSDTQTPFLPCLHLVIL